MVRYCPGPGPVQVWSRYSPWYGPDTVPAQSRYGPGTVLVRSWHGPGMVPVLFRYRTRRASGMVPVLSRHTPGTVVILSRGAPSMAEGSPYPPLCPVPGDTGTRRGPSPSYGHPHSCPRGHRHPVPPATGDAGHPSVPRQDGCPRVGAGPNTPPSHLSPFHHWFTALALP